MTRIRIGLVGVGKIARDQHIPVIAANPSFELVACTSRTETTCGIATYSSVEAMLAAHPGIDAVVVASPPAMHFEAAKRALEADKHVFLEKPPCATLTELDWLEKLARIRRRTLFQSWHLRCAPRVADAANRLKGHSVRGGRIVWKEDVRRFHPGQDWIWRCGGFGVFDPGINAISVLTEILEEPVFVKRADLFFPADCDSPVAATIVFCTQSGATIDTELDFFCSEEQTWDIELTADVTVKLAASATRLEIDGITQDFPASPDGNFAEYAPLYRRFAELIAHGESDVDATPFRLVADAFLIGRRHDAPPLTL